MALYQNPSESGVTHSSEGYALEREPLFSLEATHELDEYHDSVLPFQNSATQNDDLRKPNRLQSFRYRHSRCLVLIAQLLLGTFLASCPIPRKQLPNAIRVLLISFNAALVTFTPTRRMALTHKERIRRSCATCLGFLLSTYAIFGAVDGVHIELHWRSLLWYAGYNGFRLGLLTRWILIFVGYAIQKSSGLHSRNRIMVSYLLSILWVYADFPTTLIDHARGRTHW